MLKFSVETLGVYPDHFSQNYVFDLRDGTLLKIDDLIVKTKDYNIYDSLYNINKIKLEQELANIKRSDDSTDIDYVKEKVEESINDKTAVDFYISNDTLFFIHKPAGFPHEMRAYEMDFETFYSFDDIQPHFSNRGKSILLRRKKNYR
ncbi:hypothetical protein ACI6Q2_21775 [Chitinophagaceae bacterium LWZ2-11]